MLDRMNKASDREAAEELIGIGMDLMTVCKRLDAAWERLPLHLLRRFDPINDEHFARLLDGASALWSEADLLLGEIEAEEAAADRCEAQAEERA